MRMHQKLLSLISALALCALCATSGAAEPSRAAAVPRTGADYLTLPEQLNTDSPGKVEVIEFFAYYCPHCNLFEPKLSAWVKQQGSKIVFKRVHVGHGPKVVPQQRLFYTLESMNLLDRYHAKVFEAMHSDQRLSLDSDEAVFNWAEKAGIERAAFINTYRSFGVQAKLRRGDALMADYQVDQWPMLAFNGRYLSSPTLAGEAVDIHSEALMHDAVLRVADFLVAKVQAEKK